MTRKEEKQQLRAIVRRLEEKLSDRYRSAASAAITARLLAMPEYQAAGTVFCFVGTAREVNTLPVLEHALASGKRLCVPLCTDPGHMELKEISALCQLETGSYGIPEPSADAPSVGIDEIDFSVIPCLTCNHLGQRLGKGGGYYDRFLSHYRGGTVMLCPEKLIREEIPVEPHDSPIPWVLTEKGLYEDGIPARLG